MKALGDILKSFVGVVFAIIGGVWTAYAVLTGTMDSKDAQAKAEIRTEIYTLREERNAKIEGLSNSVNAQLEGQRRQLKSMDEKLNILIGRK